MDSKGAGEARQQVSVPRMGEFIDALWILRSGHVLVCLGKGAGQAVLDGVPLYTAMDPLMGYGLVEEFKNAEGFEGAGYYRMSARGVEFADKALAAWRATPFWQRLWVRLIH